MTWCKKCQHSHESQAHFDQCVPRGCSSFDRWRGMTCREAWPVSRFAWCDGCKQLAT